MLHTSAVLSTTGLGALYFISAPAAGVALGLGWPLSAALSWAGYSAAGLIVAIIGHYARDWMKRKFNVQPNRAKNRIFWKCWEKGGLLGLGLIAPVTIGPKGACVVGLALGEKPVPLVIAISLGAVPWALGLSLATASAFSLVH
ncbi:MAG: hypothetical protein WCI38_09140 [Chthoniobacterales bacterium]|jgi:hypothetical protein